jgi:two-component system response regulator AtoC
MPTVLIVDDDYDLVEFMADELRFSGWDADVAHDGVEAVLALLDAQYDVILMDIRMPKLDGVNALRIIRKLSPQIPVVMFTGQAGHGDIEESSRLGAFDCLLKPVSRDKLLDTLNAALTPAGFR